MTRSHLDRVPTIYQLADGKLDAECPWCHGDEGIGAITHWPTHPKPKLLLTWHYHGCNGDQTLGELCKSRKRFSRSSPQTSKLRHHRHCHGQAFQIIIIGQAHVSIQTRCLLTPYFFNNGVWPGSMLSHNNFWQFFVLHCHRSGKLGHQGRVLPIKLRRQQSYSAAEYSGFTLFGTSLGGSASSGRLPASIPDTNWCIALLRSSAKHNCLTAHRW